ncbi:Carcinoembryonic antigen-related cell adhesion molecule 3 [Lemmus lemmus]
MEESSVLLCKGCTPWKGLLLIAFLWNFWHLPTTAHVSIESVPPIVAEGDNILILVNNLPENLLALTWFKGLTNMKQGIALYALHKNVSTTGPVHSGRETIYHNGSLLIEKLTQKDTGFYTFRAYNRRGRIVSTASTYLHVQAFLWNCGRAPISAQPTIESVPPIVAEGENVRLFIHNLPENFQGFVWFKGISVFRDHEVARYTLEMRSSVMGPANTGRERVNSDGSLLLRNVTKNDTGLYALRIQCADMKSEEAHVQLLVNTFLWTCGPLSTSAQVTIESVPPIIAEGGSVLLLIHNLPENIRSLFWYKGMIVSNDLEVARHIITMNSSVLGPAHSGRETVCSNGSLLLNNVTWKDAGLYTLRTLSTDMKTELAHMQLQVNTSLSPCCNPLTSSQLMIQTIPRYAAEGENILLQVHNLPEELQAFTWYKSPSRTQVLKIVEYSRSTNSTTWGHEHSRREMVYANGSLMLQNVIEKDAGLYTLEILNRDFKIEKVDVKTSLFTCGHPPPSSQPTIELVPRSVAEGESVLLLVHNLPENLKGLYWYKGTIAVKTFEVARHIRAIDSTVHGPAYSGRELLFSNGSLLLNNVIWKDSGFYTIRTMSTDLKAEIAHVQLQVNKPVKQPIIRVINTTVAVQTSVVFTCFSADTGISIHWIFNNQSLQLTERMKLSPTKCQLSIDPVRREDAGNYKCEVSNQVSSKTSLPVRLDVMDK